MRVTLIAAVAAALLGAGESRALTTITFDLPFFADVYPTIADPFSVEPGSAVGSITFDETVMGQPSRSFLVAESVTAASFNILSQTGAILASFSVDTGSAVLANDFEYDTGTFDLFGFTINSRDGTAQGALSRVPFDTFELVGVLPPNTIPISDFETAADRSFDLITQANFERAASTPTTSRGDIPAPGLAFSLNQIGGPSSPSNATVFGAEPAVIPLPAPLGLLAMGLGALVLAGRGAGRAAA